MDIRKARRYIRRTLYQKGTPANALARFVQLAGIGAAQAAHHQHDAAHHHQQNGGGKVGFLYDEASINAQHHRKGENAIAEPPQLFFIGNKQVRKQQHQ